MLNRTSIAPLHEQLEEIFRAKLANREWMPQQKIPSENELCEEYGVSRGTIRNVISKFVFEGLFERVPGKGTFVLESKLAFTPNNHRLGVSHDLLKPEDGARSELLSIERRAAEPRVAKILQIEPGEDCFVINILSYLKDTPLIHGLSTIPCRLCPDLEARIHAGMESYTFFDEFLEKTYFLKTNRVEEILESVPAGDVCANSLRVKKGYPLLLLEDTFYTENDTPFRHSIFTFRGDRISIHIKL